LSHLVRESQLKMKQHLKKVFLKRRMWKVFCAVFGDSSARLYIYVEFTSRSRIIGRTCKNLHIIE
jgi:hypothetical protein